MCVVAIAECFRGDGEILGNPIGTIPMIGGRLARATFEPDLAMTDGEARLIANDGATAWPEGKVVEHFNPYRLMFGWVWNGRRHVIMGGSQIDQYGNQNFAAIGEYRQPKVQLLGYRGAPGNTINDTTSYWVPGPHADRALPAPSTPCAASATTGPPRSAATPPGSTRSAASSPTSPCSTSTPPTTACACARCTPA